MNSLERYKMLSNEDKSNLTIYSIYDSIYDVAKNEDINISDDVVTDIKELAYDLYLDDEYMLAGKTEDRGFYVRWYATQKGDTKTPTWLVRGNRLREGVTMD